MFEAPPRRTDQTQGVQVGRVTRVSGETCFYSVDKNYERGPARIPYEILHAVEVTVAGSPQVVTVTPRPLLVGQTVVVHATRSGQWVLARY